jgi:hypothetical protein
MRDEGTVQYCTVVLPPCCAAVELRQLPELTQDSGRFVQRYGSILDTRSNGLLSTTKQQLDLIFLKPWKRDSAVSWHTHQHKMLLSASRSPSQLLGGHSVGFTFALAPLRRKNGKIEDPPS